MFFSDIGGTEERHAHYYIHTRVRRARPRAYAQGKGRGNTGKVKKMRKGKQNGNPKKKEKTLPSATIGLTFLWGLTKKSVLPLLALTKKSIVS